MLAIGVTASLLSAKLLLAVHAAAGDLDPTFGVGGRVEDVPGEENGAFVEATRALAIQADGKLLAINNSNDSNFLLSRFKVDGSLDPTFGAGGQGKTDFGGYDRPAAISIQPDGRIVVAGYSLVTEGHMVLARYKVNGSLDTTFSSDGKVILDHLIADCRDMTLQADGKILVVGYLVEKWYQRHRSVIVRLNEDGTVDSSFANAGYLITTIWGADANPYEGFDNVVIQSDGKIIVLSQNSYAGLQAYRLLRYYPNGALDTSFGFNGIVNSAQYKWGNDLKLQEDGKIVVSGFTQWDGGTSYATRLGFLLGSTVMGTLTLRSATTARSTPIIPRRGTRSHFKTMASSSLLAMPYPLISERCCYRAITQVDYLIPTSALTGK